MKTIYFDHASTTPIDGEVLEEFMRVTKDTWGNPSAIHIVGQKARAELEKARLNCAQILNTELNEIYFCSTATEANNLIFAGLIARFERKNANTKPHILVSELEHASILEISKHQHVEIELIKVDSQGVLELTDLTNKIRPHTILISVQLANNEIGVVQPIEEISDLIKNINSTRKDLGLNEIYLHSDSVQAPLYLDVDVEKLGVDFLVLSGHKIYGPKGCALLYIRKDVEIEATIFGGGQERGFRSGTQNVPAICAFAKALEIAQKNKIDNSEYVKILQVNMLSRLKSDFPAIHINGSLENRLPNNIHFSVPGIRSDELVTLFDRAGICVSSGSSCASGAIKESRIRKILQTGEKGGEIRISIGKYNTKEEVERFFEVLTSIVNAVVVLS